MLRVDLNAESFDARSGLAVGALVVGRNVVILRDPAVDVGGARLAYDVEDVDQGDETGALHNPFGSRAIPDIAQNAAIAECQQYLRGLIVGSGMAEITAGGKLSYFPAPREIRHLRQIDVYGALQAERRAGAFQMETGTVGPGADRNVGPAMAHLDLPIGRQCSRVQALTVQCYESERRSLRLKNECRDSARK